MEYEASTAYRLQAKRKKSQVTPAPRVTLLLNIEAQRTKKEITMVGEETHPMAACGERLIATI